jgi:hypothetical protein
MDKILHQCVEMWQKMAQGVYEHQCSLNSYDFSRVLTILAESRKEELSSSKIWRLKCTDINALPQCVAEECWPNQYQIRIVGFGTTTFHKDSATLYRVFGEALHQIQNTWVKVRDDRLLQDVVVTKDPEQFDLFLHLHPKPFSRADVLIRLIIEVLDLQTEVCCDDSWYETSSHRRKMYLWIRKDAISKVERILQFKLIL